MLLIRLAASFGDTAAIAQLLAPGAITALDDIPSDDLDLIAQLLTHLLPAGWSLCLGRHNLGAPLSLALIRPLVTDGKLSDHGTREFAKDVLAAIDSDAPILILLPDLVAPSKMLPLDQICRIGLVPITHDILIAALRARHSATDPINE